MPGEFTRRQTIVASLAAGLGIGLGSYSVAAADTDTPDAPYVDGMLKRLATTAAGAEVTGPLVTANGDLFFSLQHPGRRNPFPYNVGGVGAVSNFDVIDDEFEELEPPATEYEKERVRVAEGEYQLLLAEEMDIGDGENLGIPTTPDGQSVDDFAGSRYEDLGYTPDMNQFVPTNENSTEGYLFTNFEQSPGGLARSHIRRVETRDGWRWEVVTTDPDDAEAPFDVENLVNDAVWRDVGGTRINCYGDLSPWRTPLSAEEEYAHPRVHGTNTVSDIVDAGDGTGLRGATQFWNRPNPNAIEDYSDDPDAWPNEYNDGVVPQGAFALGGVELLAYYLGADPVDQAADTEANMLVPIGEGYPNPYRTGYVVDVRNPTAETPQPLKYYVMGRYAPESPDVMADRRTVYVTSDGTAKGFYKFVADSPIDETTNPSGTLYAAKVTNAADIASTPPAQAPLAIEWLPLGSASNAEVESWIAEYDGVTQEDYLETHAETDWTSDLEQALHEADQEVVVNGNRDYVTDQEIVDWAEQYDANGPGGVDESLRKVPFLETRAAAKEIGATVEFRKAEGIDSRPGAQPGDYVYLGISEVNDGMSDFEGDLRLKRVDGGIVYRAEIQEDFDIGLLDPVVVGPDAGDPASVADDALINVDNVLTLEDGRVLLCEDADTLGRSYANDNLWVYWPPELAPEDETEESAETTETSDGEGTTTETGNEATETDTESEETTIDDESTAENEGSETATGNETQTATGNETETATENGG